MTDSTWELVISLANVVLIPLVGYFIQKLIKDKNAADMVIKAYEGGVGAMLTYMRATGLSLTSKSDIEKAAASVGVDYMAKTVQESLDHMNLSPADIVTRLTARFGNAVPAVPVVNVTNNAPSAIS